MDEEKEEDKLFELIRQEHQKGNKKEAAFRSLCSKLNYEPQPTRKTIKRWFHYTYRVDEFTKKVSQHTQKHKIKQCFLDLMRQIHLNYSILDRAVCKSKDAYLRLSYLWTNPRYRLQLYDTYFNNGNIIKLHDDFHNMDLIFPVTNKEFFNLRPYEHVNIRPITSNCFIVYQNIQSNRLIPFRFWFLSIDYEKQTCELIKEANIVNDNMNWIIYDKINLGKFVLSKNNMDAVIPVREIYSCQLKGNEVLVDDTRIAAKIRYYEEDFYALNGTKLYGLRLENGGYNQMTRMVYWEVELHKGHEEERILFEFEFTFDVNSMEICNKCYDWFNDKCYMIASNQLNGTEYLSYIICFDVQTRKCSILKDFFFNAQDKFIDVCVDGNDGVLCVQGQDFFYRLPLRQPESLQNLCWFSIKRQTMFTGNNLYNKVKKLLPQTSELRPFYFKF